MSEEFAAWFEALDEPQAERVVAALEVVAAAGTALDAAKCSPWLLWFDGMRLDAARFDGMQLDGVSGQSAGRSSWRLLTAPPIYTELMRVHREAVLWLDSAGFQNALRGLDSARLERASEAVQNLRSVLRATWAGLSRVALSNAALFGTAGPRAASASSENPSSVSPGAGSGSAKSSPPGEAPAEAPSGTGLVRAAVHAVAAAVGLAVIALDEPEHGLRELTITESTPQLRVIFGLDRTAGRLLALVGDALTRQYYGDSVRLAERRWREYLERGSQQGRLPAHR